MNRFRTKKKAKEAPDGPVRVSTESDVPSLPPVKKSRTFGRSKKIPEPEPVPEPKLDVANALPPSDDFRTSLLMSGLSARFSMLREQDDPKSKIGKASDDSVLFPKRQSKFNDFNFQSPYGLSDIAEVSSINGSIRPPFAAMERKDSYSTLTGSFGTDDDSIHSGSIMNRSKPGEGNNLFGGRQKIYKLPANSTASSKSLADGSGMGGRAVYDHDVSQSAFQKLREREREQERERLAMEESEAQSSRPPSPPLSGYNRNRETSSTTSSTGPSITRASTAATSFSSQRTPSVRGDQTPVTPGGSVSNGGLERSTTKTRRLYETGLDQHLHDQQHSAMSRIDTLSKRSIGTRTPPLNSPTTNFQAVERWDRQVLAGKASMPNLRPTSPTLNGLNSFDFAVKSTDHPDSRSYGMASPPLSPPITENEDVVVLPVRPNDRGKATALGTFSKPAQAYDEGKYSQRQVQMQQGRETPPLRKHAPPDAFAPHHQQPNGRSRAGSNATFASGNSGRSRSNSSAQRQFLPQGIPEILPPKTYPQIPENRAVTGTFLSSPDESVVSSPAEPSMKPRNNQGPLDLSKMNFQDQNVSLERPDESQHPAHRNSPAEISNVRNGGGNVVLPGPLTPDFQKSALNLPADSPTLGPTPTTTGLSGMVRQHLRSDSNSSSVYGGVSSGPSTSRFPPDQSYYSSSSNPWDTETWDQGYYDNTQYNPEAPNTEARDVVPPPLAVQSPDNLPIEENRKSSWEKELEAHHTRNESTETQKERLDFKNELAERRRRVQENLKSFVETDSRSASPGPEIPKEQPSVRANALGLLKAKTSRGSLVVRTREPPQSKAMKMLGIGSATMTTSPSPSRQEFDENVHNREEAEASDGAVREPTMTPQTRAFRQARRDAQRDRERQMAMRHQNPKSEAGHNPEWSPAASAARPLREPPSQRVPPNIQTGRQQRQQRSPSREPQPPPITTRATRNGGQQSQSSMGSNRSGSSPPGRPSRDRSSSGDSSGRSKSRNGKYRDDLAKAMAEGVSSSSQGMYNELSVPTAAIHSRSPVGGLPASPSPMPSPMMQLPNTGRSRSNSRVGGSPLPSPYPEPQSLQPVQTENGQYGLPLSPRPSPTGFVINPTPVQPSPASSGAAAPTIPVSQPQTRIPGARKKSINKHDISEPKFVSSTSRITTVNLPPEASLQNGMDIAGAPPIPPVNPARRQPRGMFGLRGKKDGMEEIQNMPAATQSTEEMSTFSDDGESKPRVRQKLRKSSSEGGNLNARARQAASAKPGPAMPTNNFGPSRGNSPPRPAEGGMF